MLLQWNTLPVGEDGKRVFVSFPSLLPGEQDTGNALQKTTERFNRFSHAFAEKTAACPGGWNCVRCNGTGYLSQDRYVSIRLDILLFRDGTLGGLCRVCHSWDLKKGTLLRLCDVVTNQASAKASFPGWKKEDWYFDESGVHLYICNFNAEEAKHCRVSHYPSFLQDAVAFPAFC